MEYVSRCPACSSLVRPGQDWCTLCHEDLRPPELRPSAALPAPAEEELDPLEAPLTLLVADRAPEAEPSPVQASAQAAVPVAPVGKHARQLDPDPVTAPDLVARVATPARALSPEDEIELAALIARLAAESPDPLGRVSSRLPETQAMRIVLALAVGGGVALVVILVTWVLGLIFG
jgi:hypothetical protein